VSRPLVLGAGPAGSMAAMLLARGGAEPILIDRDAEVGDALCGGFMSWRTAARLQNAGLELADLGAQRVTRLALYAGRREAHAQLPEQGYGLSRHALDTKLRAMAVEAGAQLEIDRAREVSCSGIGGVIAGERQDWRSDTIFLASGKHDVRRLSRPRVDDDSALGIRMRIPCNAELAQLVGDAIELHFFPGGYAGIVLQEDGAANICLALRKSLLAEAGGTPRALLLALGEAHPAFGKRIAHAAQDLPIQTIGAVPYGWIARDTVAGLFRLGDQAAVIPSLAGEGMAIALASAENAVVHWLAGGASQAENYQRAFAAEALRPVKTAKAIWSLAETRHGGQLITAAANLAPPLANMAMRASRIG